MVLHLSAQVIGQYINILYESKDEQKGKSTRRTIMIILVIVDIAIISVVFAFVQNYKTIYLN